MARGVVVEGPDGSGKTELIRKLRNELGWPVVHVVQPKVPDIRQMWKFLDVGPVIFDRFHLSPVVYGDVLREGAELDWHDIWALEGGLAARNFVTVICSTGIDTMVANNCKAPQLWEETKVAEVVQKLDNAYRRCSGPRTTFYDYKLGGHQGVLEFLNAYGSKENPRGVLGTPLPNRWLVGDVRSGSDWDFELVPFYAPGTGDRWMGGTVLGLALCGLGWDWDTTALSNSLLRSPELGEVELPLLEYYEELGRPKVIALGGESAERLGDLGIPFKRAPHPQYWRRFHVKEGVEGYMGMLREAWE